MHLMRICSACAEPTCIFTESIYPSHLILWADWRMANDIHYGGMYVLYCIVLYNVRVDGRSSFEMDRSSCTSFPVIAIPSPFPPCAPPSLNLPSRQIVQKYNTYIFYSRGQVEDRVEDRVEDTWKTNRQVDEREYVV